MNPPILQLSSEKSEALALVEMGLMAGWMAIINWMVVMTFKDDIHSGVASQSLMPVHSLFA